MPIEYGEDLMKRFLALALALTIFPLTHATASAPAPTWAKNTFESSTFTWGNWFPCKPEFQMTDCIQSVYWIKNDGTRVTGEWDPKPGVDFNNFHQTWAQESNGESAQDFHESIALAGSYKFQGLATPCGDANIVIDARPTRAGFQVNGKSTCGTYFQAPFEERFEVTLKSQNLKGYIGGVSSTGKNPRINFSEIAQDQSLTISANFAYTAWDSFSEAGVRLNTCEQNNYKAAAGGWGFWNDMFWTIQNGDTWLAQHPGDMIAGSNGWNCGGRMVWDPVEHALIMQVGSPHYDPNGNVVEGWYEGAIRGRYLTKLFQINPQEAAGHARLEIVYNDGQTKVATITAEYDPGSDWLYLKGYGFTYSNPKLMVKFDVPKDISPVKTSTTPSINKSITCVKGKLSKK